MTKKVISAALVVCLLLNLSSCYSTKTTRYYEMPAGLSQYDSITVHTKDGAFYIFVSGAIVMEKFIGTDNEGKSREIDFADISYIELQKKDLSTGNTVVAVVGITLLATVLTVGIILAIASCPHVSTFDGKSWLLEAEPNGGAITKTTEYTDYSVLHHLRPLPEGVYRMRFETILDEVDFSNEVKLLAVDHEPGLEILPDVYGNMLALSEIRRPDSALTDSGIDLLKRFDAHNELYWDGDVQKGTYDEKHPRDEIRLKFRKPEGSRKGVLVFEGRSTFWSTYVMADFLSRFGASASARLDRLENDSRGREKVRRFMERSGYHMEVLLKSNGDWMHVGYFKTAGTYVSKVQALQIDLPEDTGEIVELKLRFAPYFWNIQDMGMSFSFRDRGFRITELAPIEAMDSKRGDVLDLVLADDDAYYRTKRGDRAEISFPVPPAEGGLERTLILKTSGYYNFILDKEKELPFLAKVWHTVKKQGIDGYSLERFRALQRQAAD